MNLKLFLRIVQARFLRIVLALALTVTVAVVVTDYVPREYTTYASLVLGAQDPGPFEQGVVPRQFTAAGYVMTQVDIISSRNVASKVADQLTQLEKIVLAGSFLTPEEARRAVVNDGWIGGRLVGELLNNLEIRPSRESMVLDINYTAPDAALAAKIANAFADAYIEVSLELNTEPARRNAEWFDDQLKELRAKLEEKQGELTAYQERHGIVSIDERLDTETKRFEELSTNLVEAQARTYDVESRQLGQQHPEYVRAIERERAVEAALDRQQARLFEVRRLRDELDLLLGDVESARSNYDAAMQRFYRSSLESQFNQTNVAVLNRAAVPGQASSPNVRLNVALSVFLGLVFGFGLALLSESLDRRVRIEEDLNESLGLPVLASV